MLFFFRFLSLLLTLLCLPSLSAWGQDAGSSTAVNSVGMETFVVARPVSSTPPSGAGTDGASVSAPTSRPSSPDLVFSSTGALLPGSTNMTGDAILTLFPGISGLETGVSGQWQGRSLEARLHPGDWFQHGLENDPGFVQLGDDVGRPGFPDGLSGQRGLRLLVPLAGRNGAFGMGLYRTDSSLGLVPGVDGLWAMGSVHFNAQAGLDGSWRVQSRTRGGWLETDGFAERTGDTGSTLYGMGLSARLSGASTVFQRVVFRPDGRGISLWSLGGVQRVGAGILTLDNQIVPLASSTLHQTTMAFHLPLRRQEMLLIWQQNAFGTQREQQMQVMTFVPVSRSLTGWLGEGLEWQPSRGPHSVLTMGASLTPIGRWSARAEWSQSRQGAPFLSTTQVRASLGFQYSPNLQVKVLCGPAPLESGAGTFRPAWGLQVTRRFAYRAAPATGSVQGRVLLDGLPCAQPLGVLLDGQDAGNTDKNGQFILHHVALGAHSVSLALASLPADMNPAEPACPVDVGSKRSASVLLHVGHVGQVTGHLDVGADELGATDPTAAIGVTFADEAGHATTTDANGNFVLGSLTPGRHVIHVVASTLPPRFCVLSAAQMTADVVLGQPSAALRFRAAPERHEVQFADLQTAGVQIATAPPAGIPNQNVSMLHSDGVTPPIVSSTQSTVLHASPVPAAAQEQEHKPVLPVRLVASAVNQTPASPLAGLKAQSPSRDGAPHQDTRSTEMIGSETVGNEQDWFSRSGTTLEKFATRCSRWLQTNKGGQTALAVHLQVSGVPENVIGQVLPYVERKGEG